MTIRDQGTVSTSDSVTIKTELPLNVQTRMPHAIIMMLIMLIIAAMMSYVVPSGEFMREGRNVIPGTYHVLSKEITLKGFFWVKTGEESKNAKSTQIQSIAHPVSLVGFFASIPAGMNKQAPVIIMLMFAGGLIAVLMKTGAVDTGITNLVERTGGNIYLLTCILMLVLSAGSTFLGLISEYVVIIPLMVVLSQRIGLPPLFGTAIVTLAAKIGYIASVSNPFALIVAQPLVNLPVGSGMWLRLIVYFMFLLVSIGYVMLWMRGNVCEPIALSQKGGTTTLTKQHTRVWLVVAVGVVVMVLGVVYQDWKGSDLATFYCIFAICIGVMGGLGGRSIAESFIDGMKHVVLAGVLIGLATAVELVLDQSKVLDTIVYGISSIAEGQSPAIVAQAIMGTEMLLDVLMSSTSGKAAISMPILGPIGHIAGVNDQVTVLAFLFGGGLMNLITPTSGLLLAFLNLGKVSYGEWFRFILPLFFLLTIMSSVMLFIAVMIGYS